MVSTANVALQDQIYSKDLPLLRKIIPDLRFTAAFGRGRYVCPRNLTALASTAVAYMSYELVEVPGARLVRQATANRLATTKKVEEPA